MFFKTLVKSGVLGVLLICVSGSLKAQLRADFSANLTSGCAPIVVQFSDLSSGAPTSWQWDLGNGTLSFLQNPSVTYFSPGVYTIRLTVQNATGQDSITKTQFIEVYGKPELDFQASTTNGCFPLPVQFTDLTNPVSGTIATWVWDFGDGVTSTDQNPQHTYYASGNYNVSLQVTNSHGCTQNITRPQYIRIADGVTAGFTHSQPDNCNFPVSISFQNTSAGTGALQYQWDFGDGQTSSEENPVHQYTAAGSYSVRLVVTNTTGCTDTMYRPNSVVIGMVDADFTTPATICVNTPFRFTNTSTPSGAGAEWDFGDGTTSQQSSPNKTYTLPGTYAVTLISGSGGCHDTIRRNITVMPQPLAAFTANPVQSCRVPVDVHFTNQSNNALTYRWDFGDGNTSTDPNPVHQYTAAGSYTVTLISTNASGCSDTATHAQLISITLPSVSILNLPQEGCTPFSWTFESSVTATDSVTNYWWDFGDGNTSTEQTPTHIFAEGIFNIKLAITTQNGCTDTVVVNEGIRAGDRPVAAFSATPLQTCAWQTITFTDLTTDTADKWMWEFGDGGTSALQNPTYKYKDTGYFTVKLIVWNLGCSDTLEVEDFIYIDPPIAKMRIDFNCDTPMQRRFTDLSVGADSWMWDFGDGNSSVLQNPVHTYSTPGTYRVWLYAFNNETGCSDTTARTIQVMDEIANFSASDTIVCKNAPVTFTGLNNPQFISGYFWDFGDGTQGSGAVVTHAYSTPGQYTISLFIKTIDGCRDTLIRQNHITVYGPTAAFGSDVPGSCKMSPITFLDSSSTDGIHPITAWTWSYGDGIRETRTSAPFGHTYQVPGNFSVTLLVTDSRGCTDSITRSNLITISNPRAAFSSPDSLTCPGRTIQMNSHSSGPAIQHFWNFGDGNTSTDRNPTHNYAADGIYDIHLLVVDRYGCRDSLTRPAYIHIVTPQPAFTVSDTLGTCPPLVATFHNNSTNYNSFIWDFGDGTTSTQASPAHFYATPGVYTSSLTLTGPGGCTASVTQNIVVRGPQGTFNYAELVGCDPHTVTFRATTLDRVSFIWDFNDGNTVATTDSVISHTYTRPGNYVPKMILLDAGGCVVPVIGADTIRVKGVEVNFTNNVPLVCDTGVVNFTNLSTGTEPIASYAWDFGDGNTSTAEHPTHVYTSVGIFRPSLHVTTISGCSKTFTSPDSIKVVAAPRGAITQTEDGCAPLTATFQGRLLAADTSTLTWNWNFGNGEISDVQNPSAQQYINAGNYPVQLIIKNSDGCADTLQTTVRSFAIPTVQAGEDVLVCLGTGETLQATGAATYVWSPATGLDCTDCATPVANPTSNIIYTVIGRSAEGCEARDEVNVTVQFPFEISTAVGDTICAGASVRLEARGAYAYTWYPSTGLNNANIASPIATPNTTTQYMVVGRDDKNCFTDTAYVPIRVYPVPTVDAGEDVTINAGQMVDLMPRISSDVTNVTWSPSGSTFRSNYPGITVKPRETTTFTVDVTNSGGCMARDRVVVHVICNGANVFVPNTFSPNNDGSNDVFYPRGTGLFRIKSAKIFNRWGEIVYQRNDFTPNDAQAGWDGTYKGRPLSPDVYVYLIEVMCDNNTILPLKGNVALIR